MSDIHFPLSAKAITIAGPVGQLQAVITPPENTASTRVAIVCHPHPLYGGTMTNKVVTTTARAFNELGFWSVCFNYRGVGKSAGSYGAGIGEAEDLKAVVVWVREQFPGGVVWLAGFSFGSYVAAQVACKDKTIGQLVTIAPAVTHFNFNDCCSITCPWLLIMGEADEVVSVAEVKSWINQLPRAIQTIFLPGVSHFFHGHLLELRRLLIEDLQPNVPK